MKHAGELQPGGLHGGHNLLPSCLKPPSQGGVLDSQNWAWRLGQACPTFFFVDDHALGLLHLHDLPAGLHCLRVLFSPQEKNLRREVARQVNRCLQAEGQHARLALAISHKS